MASAPDDFACHLGLFGRRLLIDKVIVLLLMWGRAPPSGADLGVDEHRVVHGCAER
jgi:hypothetical protein